MKLRILAWCLCICLLLTGCDLTDTLTENPLTDQPEEVETSLTDLTLLYYPDNTLHPLLDTSLANQKVNSIVYLPSVTFDGSLSPLYGCATEVVQKGNSISITPNTERRFSDGSALTAKDIADSFQFVLDHSQSPYYRQLSCVTDVRALNGRVVIDLKHNTPHALYCMDIPIVKVSGSESKPVYLGCGDYRFSTHNNVPVLSANPHTTAPTLSPIYLLTPDSSEALGSMFNSGVLSVLHSDLIEEGTFTASRRHKTASYLTNTMIFVGVNSERDHLSSAVRRALSALLPREDIVQSVLMGLGQSAALPFSPALSGVPAAPKSVSKDRLLELFSAAGMVAKNGELTLPDGSKPTYKVLVCKDSKEHLAVAEKLRSAALSLGIIIEIESVSEDSFSYRLEQGSFDLYVARYTLNKTMDATELFLGEEGVNYCGEPSTALQNAYNDYLEGGPLADYIAVLERECPILPVAFLKTAIYYTEGVTPTGNLSLSRPFGALENWKVS